MKTVDEVVADLGVEGRRGLRDAVWDARSARGGKVELHEAPKGTAQLRAANLVSLFEVRGERRRNGRRRRHKFYRLTDLGHCVRDAIFELDRVERATRFSGFFGPLGGPIRFADIPSDLRITLPFTSIGSPPHDHHKDMKVYSHACPLCRAAAKR